MIAKKTIATVAIGVYLAVLLTPAVYLEGKTLSGWEMWLQGFASTIFLLVDPSARIVWVTMPWFGNVAFFASLLLMAKGRYRASWILAAASVVMMLSYLFDPVAMVEGNGEGPISVRLHAGYWLWVASPSITAYLLDTRLPKED